MVSAPSAPSMRRPLQLPPHSAPPAGRLTAAASLPRVNTALSTTASGDSNSSNRRVSSSSLNNSTSTARRPPLTTMKNTTMPSSFLREAAEEEEEEEAESTPHPRSASYVLDQLSAFTTRYSVAESAPIATANVQARLTRGGALAAATATIAATAASSSPSGVVSQPVRGTGRDGQRGQQSRSSSQHPHHYPFAGTHQGDINKKTKSGAAAAAAVAVDLVVQRVYEATQHLARCEEQLVADEGYFDDVAEVEACVMHYLREWRSYTDSLGDAHGISREVNSDAADGLSSNSGATHFSGAMGTAVTAAAAATGRRRVDAVASQQSTTTNPMSNSNSSSGVHSVSGNQRVQADLDGVRQCAGVMHEIHNALAMLEDEHRQLQRRYIVEKVVQAELTGLEARIAALEAAVMECQASRENHDADDNDGEGEGEGEDAPPPRRQPHKDTRGTVHGKPKLTASQNSQSNTAAVSGYGDDTRACQMAQESLAASRRLLDALRQRVAAVVERLTDELLWMQAEVRRHDWSALRTATALTRMEPVVVTLRGQASRASAAGNDDEEEKEEGEGENDDERVGDDGRYSGSASSRPSRGSARLQRDCAGTGTPTATQRDSFLLRVQVPVFVNARAPPLSDERTGDEMTGSDGSHGASSRDTSGRPSRSSTGGFMASLSEALGAPRLSSARHSATVTPVSSAAPAAGRRTTPLGGGGSGNNANGSNAAASAGGGRLSTPSSFSVSSQPSPATVSVVATPARYALVQLYELCTEFLAQMFQRLSQLRARRSAEASQLAAELQQLDDYDPAADEVSQRLDAVGRYLAQLEAWVREVQALNQSLHEEVKLPVDAALQTYERFRSQLLDVLKQRLEQEEEEEAEERRRRRAMESAEEEELTAKRDADGDYHDDGAVRGATRVGTVADAESVPVEGMGDGGGSEEGMGEDRERQGVHRGVAATTQDGAEKQNEERHPSSLSAVSGGQVGQQQGTVSPSRAELPRASAEFVGMLETLLKNQEQAAAAAAEEGRGGGNAIPTAAQRVSSASSSPPPPVSTPPQAEAGQELPEVTVIRMTSHPVASTAAATGGESEGDAVATRHTGRRRARDSTDNNADGAGDDGHDDGDGDGVVATAGGSTGAPPASHQRHHRHHSSSTHTAAAAEGLNAEHEVMVVDVSSSPSSLSGGDDSDEDHEEEEDAERYAYPRSQAQPQRYALGSGESFTEGVKAFFSAVVRRVLNFGDDDDDVADGALERGRGGGAAPQRKRSRYE